MSVFIPSGDPADTTDEVVPNDGWFPDLSVSDFRAQTGTDGTFGTARLATCIRSAMVEVNAGLSAWRTAQTADSLAAVPCQAYGDVPVKITLYKTGVYARARALLIETVRAFDSTKSGHDRADALEETADGWLRQSNEALSRLADRQRTVVELI